MKVGILTFHEVFNPGAFLQALATQRLVESFGHEAYIINYTPSSHRYSLRQNLRKLSWRIPFRFPRALNNYHKDKAFAAARKQWMNLTRPLDTASEVAKESFDVVLVGADVVWNYTIKQYGQDPLYFGEGLNTRKRISFAPSFGPCTLSDTPPAYVKEGLAKFDSISVRDKNSQEIVKALTEIEPPVICDPAFHLDHNQLPLACDEKEPFLLVYLISSYVAEETVAQIRSFAKSKGLKVVATMYHLPWADKIRTNGGPMEWLGLIHHAEYVVTNTFHGIVFCSKMEKKFAFQYTPSIRTKSLYTVEKLGIDSLLVDKNRSVESALNSDFEFSQVRKQIANLADEGKSFLVDALGSLDRGK